MRCPTCNSDLVAGAHEDVLMHRCPECGGDFVGGDGLGLLGAKRESTLAREVVEAMAADQPTCGLPIHKPREVCCPACDHSMAVVNCGGDAGISIDRCDNCGGIWLDAPELEKVRTLQSRWEVEAPTRLRAIARTLEQARRATPAAGGASRVHRFAFVGALLGRFFDAA